MIILVTGVFDILHEEHKTLLTKAKALGGRLIVGIESDARVQQLKGKGRPINAAAQRRAQLLSLGIADEVIVLPDAFDSPDDHRQLLARIQPDILAVSSHFPHLHEKERLMQEIGGKVVVVHEHNPTVSSTILLKNKQKVKNGKS